MKNQQIANVSGKVFKQFSVNIFVFVRMNSCHIKHEI